MLNCVLVTPIYEECGREAGVFTRSLAELLIRSGHRVEVICSHADAPRPSFEDHGRYRVQRLHAKRQNLETSFSAAAAAQLFSLCRRGRCDRIVAIDCPLLHAMLDLTRVTGQTTPHARSIAIPHHEDVPLPIFEGMWHPPTLAGPSVLGTELDEASRALLIRAFRASDAPKHGWGLKLHAPDGSWQTIEDCITTSEETDAILVPMRHGTSMISMLARSAGITSIDYSIHAGEAYALEQELSRLASVSVKERREAALSQWALTQHQEQIEHTRTYWLDRIERQDGHSPDLGLAQWKTLERCHSHSMHAGDVA